MTDEIKLGRQVRDLATSELKVRKRENDGAQISFSASSEIEIERWFGTEILVHDETAVRLDRVKGGAVPMLFNHNWDDPIGMVDSAKLEGGRLIVDAHLFATERSWAVEAMIAGGLRNVSIGYQVLTFQEDAKKKVYRAIDWEPLEMSVVTVPADASVGIGRDKDDVQNVRIVRHNTEVSANEPLSEGTIKALHEGMAALRQWLDPENEAAAIRAAFVAGKKISPEPEVRAHTAAAAAQPGVIMSDAVAATVADPKAVLPAEPRQALPSLDAEKQRMKGIENLCTMNKIGEDQKSRWIADGTDIVQATDEILLLLKERGERNPNPVTRLGLSTKEQKRFSLARMILAVKDREFTDAGFEVECSREISTRLGKTPNPNKFYVPFEVQQQPVQQTRDLTVATAGAGGYLVQTSNMGFIDLLRNRSVAMRMGATRLSGLRDSITIPRQTVGGTAIWLANEASTITESTPTFVQIALSPKSVGAYSEISRQLLLQSNPAADAIVTGDLAAQTAIAADLAVLEGSGAGGQPTGISGTSGIGSVTGTSLGFAGILNFQEDVATANVMPVRGGYVTTPAVSSFMIQRVKYASTASPLWEGNIWDGTMQGFPAMSSNQLTAATMIFGDWANIIIAEWGTLEVEVNPFANFQAGIVGVRAIYSMDVGVRVPASFSRAVTIT